MKRISWRIKPSKRIIDSLIAFVSFFLSVAQSTYASGDPFGLDKKQSTWDFSGLGHKMKFTIGGASSNVMYTEVSIKSGFSDTPEIAALPTLL